MNNNMSFTAKQVKMIERNFNSIFSDHIKHIFEDQKIPGFQKIPDIQNIPDSDQKRTKSPTYKT